MMFTCLLVWPVGRLAREFRCIVVGARVVVSWFFILSSGLS